MKKIMVLVLKQLDLLSAISCRLTKLTGKSAYPIHPKHLVKEKIWFLKYLKKDDVVLELGSNSGQMTLKIAQKTKKVIGGEIEDALLKIATATALESGSKNIQFIKLDGNKKLPFKNEYFTKVVCTDVLEHLKRRKFALLEIQRVLKKKGQLILVTDNPNTSWKRLQKSVGLFYYADREHYYEYSKDEIANLLDETGFKIFSIETVTYDTPIKGLIDLVGGISLQWYQLLRSWRSEMNKKYPQETTGYRIIAHKL